jgi:hypothetical protein
MLADVDLALDVDGGDLRDAVVVLARATVGDRCGGHRSGGGDAQPLSVSERRRQKLALAPLVARLLPRELGADEQRVRERAAVLPPDEVGLDDEVFALRAAVVGGEVERAGGHGAGSEHVLVELVIVAVEELAAQRQVVRDAVVEFGDEDVDVNARETRVRVAVELEAVAPERAAVCRRHAAVDRPVVLEMLV